MGRAPNMENWLPVLDFEDLYIVSDLGKVKSLDRVIRCRWGETMIKPGRVLKPRLDKRGYYRVCLARNRVNLDRYVHRIVAMAFIPTPSIEGLDVHHIDFDVTNNALTNLKWCSRRDNVGHSVAGGRFLSERMGTHKLVPSRVVQIRERLAQGASYKDIVQEFEISKPTISRIATCKSWKRITLP